MRSMLSNTRVKHDLLSLALCHFDFLTPTEKQILQNKLDNVHELALLSMGELTLLVGRTFSTKAVMPSNIVSLVEKDVQLMRSYSIGVLFTKDSDYPPLLKEIYDPPFALFYRGNKEILQTSCIAVVGTRHPTGFGMKSAMEVSHDFCGMGITIVSGLAYGIDCCAHRGALKGMETFEKGSTIAVLASGLDAIYPAANRNLAAGIIQNGGCLVSEYPPDMPPLKWHFPQRNRIISGLSEACLVVEAPLGSGALITADFALEQNRDLFFHEAALKYPYKKPLPNTKKMSVPKYIEEGATVINSAEDMIEKMKNPCKEHTEAGLHFTQLRLDLN